MGHRILIKLKQVIVILLVFVCYWSKAQSDVPTFGIKAGIIQTMLYGTDVNQISTRGPTTPFIGLNIGISINSKRNKNFWFKHEAFLVQKGAILQIMDKYNPTYKSNFKSLYVDIFPISPTFHIKGLQIFVGPFIGVLLNSSIEQKDSSGNLHVNKNIFGTSNQLSKYRQKFDAGFIFGLEYEFKIGINVGVRYIQGFVPLIENAAAVVSIGADELPQQKIYNQSLSLTVGYSLNIKKESKKSIPEIN